MLACVTAVRHARVEGKLGVMLLEPLTSSRSTTCASANFCLCPVEFRDEAIAYLFTVILLSLSRWCYSAELGMEELGTVAA